MTAQPLEEINAVQKRVLDFIAGFLEDRGLPTHREIGKACAIANRSSVGYHLRILEEKGLLKKDVQRHRGLELVGSPFRLPILGRVGAGGQIIAQEDIEGYISVDRRFAQGSEFLLRVKGDSMTQAGIVEGDLVQVRRQYMGREGEIVVALVGEEGVVKRLARRGSRWILESANPRYSPITEEFNVIGKVVGLIRRYES